MSKIKMEWLDTGWFSCQVENPQSKKAYQRAESKQICRQVKQLNRKQQRIIFRQFGRTK